MSQSKNDKNNDLDLQNASENLLGEEKQKNLNSPEDKLTDKKGRALDEEDEFPNEENGTLNEEDEYPDEEDEYSDEDDDLPNEDDEFSTIFGKKERIDSPKKSPRGKGRSLLFGILSVVLLAGVMTLILLLFPAEEETADELQLVNLETAADIAVQTDEGNYTIQNEESVLSIKDWDTGLPLDTGAVQTIWDNFLSLTAVRRMQEGNDNLTEYGLESPAGKVVITHEGGEITILLGDISPDQSGCYFQLDGTDGVYLLSLNIYEAFHIASNDLIDKTITAKFEYTEATADYFDATENLNKFDQITLSGSIREKPITLTMSENAIGGSYWVSEPMARYADTETVADLLTPLSYGMVADSIYEVKPDESALKRYGLDKPVSEIIYEISGENFTLTFGDADDENYAVMVSGNPVIYQVDKSRFTFIEYTALDLYSSRLLYKAASELSSLAVEFEGETTEFTFLQTTSEDDGSTATTVYANGKELDKTNFDNYFYSLIAIYAQNLTDEPVPDEKSIASFTFTDLEGEKVVYSFYPYSDRRVYVAQDGRGSMLIVPDVLDNIKQLTKDLLDGKEIAQPS